MGAGRSGSAAPEIAGAALRRAESRAIQGSQDTALHAFLNLNAGYFLGEWLASRTHRALVQRPAEALDGIADLPVPADAVHAAQLAQHVRELAAELGPTPWTTAMTAQTAALAEAGCVWPARPQRLRGGRRAATA